MRRLLIATVLGALAVAPAQAQDRSQDPLRLFAAGSLTGAMTDMLAQSGLPATEIAPPTFGPSGVLREKIEAGAPADVLASADMAHPRRLAHERGLPVIMFVRNRMCMLARSTLALTPDNLLDRMLDPALRLATSTPGADPGGDYAWAVFARAEAVRPGAKAALEAKALKLVGGPDSKPLIPGEGQAEGVFLADAADMMLSYCTSAAAVQKTVPNLVSMPVPAPLAVGPAYGMVVLSDKPSASRFARFILSENGQAILARYGFQPVTLPD